MRFLKQNEFCAGCTRFLPNDVPLRFSEPFITMVYQRSLQGYNPIQNSTQKFVGQRGLFQHFQNIQNFLCGFCLKENMPRRFIASAFNDLENIFQRSGGNRNVPDMLPSSDFPQTFANLSYERLNVARVSLAIWN